MIKFNFDVDKKKAKKKFFSLNFFAELKVRVRHLFGCAEPEPNLPNPNPKNAELLPNPNSKFGTTLQAKCSIKLLQRALNYSIAPPHMLVYGTPIGPEKLIMEQPGKSRL